MSLVEIDLTDHIINLQQGTYVGIEEYHFDGSVKKTYDGYYNKNEMLNSLKNKIFLYKTRDDNGNPTGGRSYVLDPNKLYPDKAYYFNGDFPPPLTYGIEGNGPRSGGTRSKKRRRRRTKRR